MNILDELKFVGGTLLIVTLILLIIFGISRGGQIIFEQNYCKTLTTLNIDFEFRWELWGGCLVQTPSGYWIHASEYKYLESNIITENK